MFKPQHWCIRARRQTRVWHVILGFFLLGAPSLSVPLLAQFPALRLTQYAHNAWRLQDNAFDGAPDAITQTTDGYLWIGTAAGLVRFDGIRFVPWRLPETEQQSRFSIYSLLGAKDGSLWIGTQSKVERLQDNRVTYVSETLGRINSLLQDANGRIWLARTRFQHGSGPLCSIDAANVRCYAESEGMACRYGQILASDGSGGLWMGSNPGVCHWSPKSNASYLPRNSKQGDTAPAVSSIARTVDGKTIIGYSEAGPELGLQQLVDGHWEAFNARGLQGSSLQVSALMVDHDGSLWIGTIRQGLYHLANGAADHFGTAEGLSGNFVSAFYQDFEGSIWVATSGGLDRFHPMKATPFTQREGLVSDDATSVLARSDGSVLIGSIGGLNIMKDGRLSTVRAGKVFPGSQVTSMLADANGTLWIGIDDRLTLFRDGHFRTVPTLDGQPPGQVYALIQDPQRAIWAFCAGKRRTLFRVTEQRMIEVPTPGVGPNAAIAPDTVNGFWLQLQNGEIARFENGTFHIVQKTPPHYDIERLHIGPDRTLWAWGETGLLHLQDNSWAKLDSHNGLPCDAIHTALEDADGNFWLYMHCGIAVISHEDIAAWSGHLDQQVHAHLLLDASDGARPGFSPFTPEVTESRDGRLWFAHEGVLQVVDKKHLPFNVIPPPVHIERILADQRTFPISVELSLPALTRSIQIDYTGLSYIAPQKVYFRYKLSGVDKDWQDAGSRRQAFYTNLSPGKYTFEVRACNNDGVWNTLGDKIQFAIQPKWYQTAWLRCLAVVATLMTIWALSLLRVRYATARVEDHISLRLAERDRIARELHDTLLQGFQGLVLRFQMATNAIPTNEPARKLMESALDRADEVLLEGRDRVRDLRSQVLEIELSRALERIANDLQQLSPITFEVHEVGSSRPLQRVVQEEVFAIGRESLSNAFRHSGASSIVCEIVYERSRFLFVCQDNGKGIDPQILDAGEREGHWGLLGMQERARRLNASLHVQSSASTGTRIELSVRGRIAYHHADKLTV